MLKETVAYKDYNGNERTEELYFNMNQFELTEFAASLPDDLFDAITDANDKQGDNSSMTIRVVEKLGRVGVIDFIKRLVLDSYGVKSEDGLYFEKSDEIKRKFSQTVAFDTVMTKLLHDDISAANFVNGIISSDMAAKLAEKRAEIATNQA